MKYCTASDVTQALAEWREGDDSALDRLIPEIYGELRRLAGRYLRREREDHTFQTHNLIHGRRNENRGEDIKDCMAHLQR